MNSINILQITVRADIGGGPEHLYRLVKGSSLNINCFIAAPNDEPYYNLFKEIVGENNLIEIPHRKFKLSSLFLLRNVVKNKSISIIHSHGKGAGIYSRLLGILTRKKVIHTFHGFHIGSYNSIQKKLYILLEKFLSKFTDKIITVSEGEKQEILNAGICSSQKIVVITNGVDIPADTVNESNFQQKPKKIISFSRFNYQKNTRLLIEICKKLEELEEKNLVEFHVYGSGEEFGLIRQLIESNKLGQRIVLHGADSNARDKLVDGFCYISTSRWEGLPISLLEAMAVGLPVLASNVVGNNDVIIDGENGLLFDINDPRSCAEKILQLASDKKLWGSLSNNARSTVQQKFSVKKMITETEKVYSY